MRLAVALLASTSAWVLAGCETLQSGLEPSVGYDPDAGDTSRSMMSNDAHPDVPPRPTPTDAPRATPGDAAGDAAGPVLAGLGAACTSGPACASGICADGVCCQTACDGTCEACDLPQSRGTCAPVAGVPHGSRTPCGGDGPCAGTCDGHEPTRCTYPGGATECAPARCEANVATTRSVCSGAGICIAGTAVSCIPFSCDGAICAGGCDNSRPCQAGSYCDGGKCFALKSNGLDCRAAAECTSGACVDRHCCGAPKCGSCEACTGAGGACVKVASMEDPDSCSGNKTCTAASSCRKKPGESCGRADDCATARCVTGRCCTVASCGQCGACTGPGGTCVKVTTGGSWQTMPGAANDIDVGADGTAWVIGTNVVPGGFGIWRWNGTGWETIAGGAVRIGVDPGGVPWVVNDGGTIFRRTGDTWESLPGAAKDIDIGADGSVWVIGTNAVPGGFGIYHWNGTGWDGIDGGATRIGVAPNGQPWVVNSAGTIFRRVSNAWEVVAGALATEVDIGSDGTAWIVGRTGVAGGFNIQRYNGTGWDTVPGGAATIGAAPNCLPWVTTSASAILRRN